MKVRGSLTVEAAFVMPIVLLVLFFTLQSAISLHETTCAHVEDIEIVESLDGIERFEHARMLKRLADRVVIEE